MSFSRRLAICAALATWSFSSSWIQLALTQNLYHRRNSPMESVMLPVLSWELVLIVLLMAGWEILRRTSLGRSVGAHIAFLLICLWPLGQTIAAVVQISPMNVARYILHPAFWPVAFMAGLALLVWTLFRIRSVSHAAQEILLYSWPVLAFLGFQASRSSLLPYHAADFADDRPATRLAFASGAPRVVWIVFDELDQHILFQDRPSSLRLPNFDRLRTESLYADAASPPAEMTLRSLPALITGRMLVEADTEGPRDLLLTPADGPRVAFRSMPNVFDEARAMGMNTALIGWFHPYGRLINHSLTEFFWVPIWMNPGIEESYRPQSLLASMHDRAILEIGMFPLLGHWPAVAPSRLHRASRIETFVEMERRAIAAAADPSMGLTLLHLPVPHPPGFYDRSRAVLTDAVSSDYLDNVALADRILGNLRVAMEKAGLWDATALLVTSDHGWRQEPWDAQPLSTAEERAASRFAQAGSVPFLLKLPGENSGFEFHRPFNTVLTRDLLTAILRRSIRTPEELTTWLNARAQRQSSEIGSSAQASAN